MDNFEYFCNSFIAFSIDWQNKKEYCLYSVGNAKKFLEDVYTKEIYPECRELGEFVFDFSTNFSGYLEEERSNILFDYIEEFNNYFKWNSKLYRYTDYFESDFKSVKKSLSLLDRPLLSEKFLESQKDLKRNERKQYSLYDIFKSDADIIESRKNLRFFYSGSQLYVATDFDFAGIMRYYVEELYKEKLFPRKCMVCGNYFLAAKKHGEVICSDNCRKITKSKNTKNYYNNLSEIEIYYSNIYRKWKRKIDKAKNAHIINDEGICRLEEELQALVENNRRLANERKKGHVFCKDRMDYETFDFKHKDVLDRLDKDLYDLFNSLKQN